MDFPNTEVGCGTLSHVTQAWTEDPELSLSGSPGVFGDPW